MGSQEKQQTAKILDQLMNKSSHGMLDVNKARFLICTSMFSLFTSAKDLSLCHIYIYIYIYLFICGTGCYNVQRKERKAEEEGKGTQDIFYSK